MTYHGFGKGSGPKTQQHTSTFNFGINNPLPRPSQSSSSSLPSPPIPRFIESSGSIDRKKPVYSDLDAHTPERFTPVTTLIASRDSMTGVTARVSRYLNPESTRSPPISYADVDVMRNGDETVPRNQPALPPRTLNGQASLSTNFVNISDHQVQSSVSPHIGSHSPQHGFTKERNSQVSKRTRSPPSLSPIRQEIAHKEFRSPSISPRFGSTSNVQRTGPHSQIHQKSIPSGVYEANASRPVSSIAPKRTRSPPPPFSAYETHEGNSISSEDNSEREMLAKAKRLARFKVELSKSEQNNADVADQKASAHRHELSVLEQKNVRGCLMDSAGNFTNGHAVSDYEGLEASNVIVGLCPDMCPESERGERERKGDLDQYERLDGDRNATTKFLAVKKYTRTAEREACLIRPLPILQKTIDYLLTLLDQPYDERFLGIYNFLWDRMRAIRMDLRMQHIFNRRAITMLEQMIKLHIIAMHEFCEYTKGEGFSEGFDAHLNIEQMNKTSVELFQMYDDHRKRGICVPTEKEFRGYYALLKLDKHPGYKVEPAELSLDLSKMTPEIRQTPEVLFARNVARACRTSNFIAFFRLARKATYLQACLMHAHFAKLRTQALASLHSGLQNNQGLPVSHVANWLAMEDECIEDLLEYHGFFLKSFEEPYMVKEGPFLNLDNDYRTKCSKLVHKKRSGLIIEDVSPSSEEAPPVETKKEVQTGKAYKHEPQRVLSVENDNVIAKLDEEMQDSAPIVSPKDGKSGNAFKEMLIDVNDSGKDHVMASPRSLPLSFPFPSSIPQPQVPTNDILKNTNSDFSVSGSPRRNLHSNVDTRLLEIVPKPAPPESSLANSLFVLPPVAQAQCASKNESLIIHQEHDVEIDDARDDQDKEIAEAKLKLCLRLWRRRVSKLRELREQKQLASIAALNSLPLGPPIRHHIDQPGSFAKFDIDIAMKERYEKQEKSCARLNVSELVASTLCRRNSDAKCLCWKIIVCSQKNNNGCDMGAAGLWLTSKLMPSIDNDVVIPSPGLAIWRNWDSTQYGTEPTCCLSVVRDAAFGSPDEVVSGASAVLFLISESVSWNLQRAHLHNLLISIPSGAHMPLLILCDSYDKGFSSVIMNELGLQDIDRSRVRGFQVVYLIEHQQVDHSGFFSDRKLREGLQWLAGESPSQPTLDCVNIRELVRTHLNSFSSVHDAIDYSKLGPNDCISLFNEAIECSLQEVTAAANSNPTGWPCPEIGLIGTLCDEGRVVKRYLPTLGWSSNLKIEPIICALQNCKLPAFQDDLSWLARGSKLGHEIENQKIQLENCLIQYLTHTSNMMGVPLARKEAFVTIQTCARLELCGGSDYHVVPHWGMIFRRIFNWRLMGLSSGENSIAYISECHHALPNLDLDVVGFEAKLSSSFYCLNPSLDEMISVNFNDQPGPGELEALPHRRDSGDMFHETVVKLREGESKFGPEKLSSIDTTSKYAFNNASRGEELMNGKLIQETDRLGKLLEQCNLLQNDIDKKLSVYF